MPSRCTSTTCAASSAAALIQTVRGVGYMLPRERPQPR